MTSRIAVLYDADCPFCLRCRDWLLDQPLLVEMELLAAGSALANDRYGQLPWSSDELTVVDDTNRVWTGPDAFILCLWATRKYRSWATWMGRPAIRPFARDLFTWVSQGRTTWSRALERRQAVADPCASGRCATGG